MLKWFELKPYAHSARDIHSATVILGTSRALDLLSLGAGRPNPNPTDYNPYPYLKPLFLLHPLTLTLVVYTYP